ncbi:MAG: hypothetical protein HFI48_05820 [Lachnospiraceae bacterium]|nr:hypothetical protein [Lachnospiraceae bacterium]
MITFTTMMSLLAVFAAVASLLTEGVKTFLNEMKISYASNILVLIISLVVGCGGTALYYVNYQVPFTALNSVYIALMGISNWLASMLGYDKVKQTLMQIAEMGKR